MSNESPNRARNDLATGHAVVALGSRSSTANAALLRSLAMPVAEPFMIASSCDRTSASSHRMRGDVKAATATSAMAAMIKRTRATSSANRDEGQ